MAYYNKYTYVSLPRTQRGQPIVLGADPKGNTFLYTNGNSVIIRNIHNPSIADVYTEHSCQVNVAKYSPSGFYIVSGDQSGKVRIWDTVNKEHILKNEFQPIAGPIKDISWSPDNQRLVVVGEGREKFGHVFMTETGTSVGEISGQSKSINSCDFRPARPFRIITGSEDNTVAVFEGPPFKFRMTKQDHTRFVQAVRYSPSGNLFASAGFDGKVFLYNGISSELVSEFGNPAHKGGVYAVAWKPDGTKILTCSGDKTCRLWDVETKQLINEFIMGTTVDDQQVSCLWQGDYILSVSLSGFINYLDINNPIKPLKKVKGHNRPITALGLSNDRSTIYTGSHDGYVTNWNKDGSNERVGGNGHGNQINALASWEDFMYSCGIDDSLRKINTKDNSYTDSVVKLNCQPRGLAIFKEQSAIVLACVKEIVFIQLFEEQQKVITIPINYEANCVAANPEFMEIAVGSDDQKLRIYTVEKRKCDPEHLGSKDVQIHISALKLKCELEHLGTVTDCSYSPDNKLLVACDTHRKIVLYSVPGYERAHNKEWGFHNARVNCVAWSPNSLFVASGSLDTTIIIWSVTEPSKHLIIKNAHPQSQITRLMWINDDTIVSTGQDCNVKIWEITNI